MTLHCTSWVSTAKCFLGQYVKLNYRSRKHIDQHRQTQQRMLLLSKHACGSDSRKVYIDVQCESMVNTETRFSNHVLQSVNLYMNDYIAV